MIASFWQVETHTALICRIVLRDVSVCFTPRFENLILTNQVSLHLTGIFAKIKVEFPHTPSYQVLNWPLVTQYCIKTPSPISISGVVVILLLLFMLTLWSLLWNQATYSFSGIEQLHSSVELNNFLLCRASNFLLHGCELLPLQNLNIVI